MLILSVRYDVSASGNEDINRHMVNDNGSTSKLSANVYDIYHCCVYSEKLLIMDRGTVQNMQSFLPK